jgi:ParB/RepB/Spo0J family partition protein
MAETQKINIEGIASTSDVNSRTIDVKVGLDGLERSMQKDGFWTHKPILIRPTDKEGYKYEIVEGQRRLLAAKNIGLSEIPAVIEVLDDMEAMRRSFTENEEHHSLAMEDKMRFAIRLWNKFANWKEAAEYGGYDVTKLRRWAKFRGYPQEIQDIAGQGKVGEDYIIRCYDADQPSDEEFIERVKFMIGKSGNERNQIISIIKENRGIKIDDIKEKFEAEPTPLTLQLEFTGDYAEGIRKASKDKGNIKEKNVVMLWVGDALKREQYM